MASLNEVRQAQHTSPIHSYVSNSADPRLAHIQAGQSTLPNIGDYRASEYYGHHPPPSVGTSRMTTHSTSTHNSCPGRSTSSTAGDSDSVASSIGRRQMNVSTRVLMQGSGGALEVPPIRPKPLECPFKSIFGCITDFRSDSFDLWYRHSLEHLKTLDQPPKDVIPPTSNRCCFCDITFHNRDGYTSWAERLRHVGHHHRSGARLAHSRPDFQFFIHLWHEGVIGSDLYREIVPQMGHPPAAQHPPSPPPERNMAKPIDDGEPVAVVNERRRRGGR